MPQRTSTPPNGPRSSRTPARGGIHKRRPGPTRVDYDGDLDMDAAGHGVGRGRGGLGRGAQQNQQNHSSNRDNMRDKPGRNGLNPSAMQNAILRGMNSRSLLIRNPKTSLKVRGAFDEAIGRGRDRDKKDGLVQIVVKGLKQSKAAVNPDGGIKALAEFIERKATAPNASASETVRIRKSRPEGDSVIVYVKSEDTAKVTRLNSFVFAGASLSIVPRDSSQGNKVQPESSEETMQLRDRMTAMLNRRYNSELKLLDLSSLGTDPELVNLGIFSSNSRDAKFFPALMTVCDSIFTNSRQKREAVVSVTLANNSLINVSSVTTLSQTFPELQNLDLSNNQLQDLGAIQAWRWKFRHLDHLVISGNPIETNDPTMQEAILKWYPTLRLLNTIQIRSDEDVKGGAEGKFPLPVLAPSFRDEGFIGENFLKLFFPTYDTNRTALANGYYDSESSFSLSINTSAPRAQDGTATKSTSWDAYFKMSRNLTRITTLPARMSRGLTGTDLIRDLWLTLPPTRHPDLLAESHKWCIECHSLPSLPDPTEQSPSGVGGLMVMVHGEFDEVDPSTRETTTTRSFDRTFVLGPGAGVGGIRVVSDILVLRAYGGSEAWQIDGNAAPLSTGSPQITTAPEGFALPVSGKSAEQLQKETMILELGDKTNMTLEYSALCLEQSGWNLEEGLLAFEKVKAILPSQAWSGTKQVQ